MTWGVVRPGTSEFVASKLRSNHRRSVAVHSPLDVLLPDSIFRGVGALEMALSGEVFRGSVCAIREVLNILAERVYRYFSFKGDTKDDLDKLRYEMAVLASKKETLRQENGELRRTIAPDPSIKHRHGNGGQGRGRGT